MKSPGIKDWGKGINRDQPAFELAPGFWSDCQNKRYYNGLAERVGGVASVITPSIVPYAMLPYSSGATASVLYMGLTKAYVHDGSSETEITRTNLPTVQSVVSATCRRAGAYVYITLTLSGNHSLAAADTFSTYGFDSGYNKAQVSNFGDTTSLGFVTNYNTTDLTFIYLENSASDGPAAGTSTSIGAYSLVSVAGQSTLNFTGAIDDRLTTDNFNGVAIVNSPKDGLFYYDQAITNKLHAFPGLQYVAKFGRAFKNYIFQGGQTISSVLYRHRLAWSASAEPGTIPLYWTASDTNDAGSVDLVSSGAMVDAVPWGEDLIVFKEDCRYRVRYIGGAFVFDFQLASGNHKDDGLLSQNCAVNTPAGQVFLTQGKDIRIHSGGESKSIANSRVQKWLRNNIDTTYQKRSFLTVNPLMNEVWVCFPKSGNSLVSKALLWNWESDAWGEIDLTNVTAGCAGGLPTTIATSPRLLIANSTPKIGLVDSGTTYFGASYQSMNERTGMDGGSTSWKTLSASVPMYRSSTTGWTAQIYHGSSATADGPVTYATPQTYTHGTSREVTAFANSGPWFAWKEVMSPSDTPAMHSLRLDVTEDGEY